MEYPINDRVMLLLIDFEGMASSKGFSLSVETLPVRARSHDDMSVTVKLTLNDIVLDSSTVIACNKCEFYHNYNIGGTFCNAVMVYGCCHSDCFNVTAQRDPIRGELEVKTRVANCDILNKNNDCFRFKK